MQGWDTGCKWAELPTAYSVGGVGGDFERNSEREYLEKSKSAGGEEMIREGGRKGGQGERRRVMQHRGDS